MDIDSSDVRSTAIGGLPYGEMDDREEVVDDSLERGKVIEAAGADDSKRIGSDADLTLRRGRPPSPADESLDVSFLDQNVLQKVEKRLAEMEVERGTNESDGWGQRDELADLVCTQGSRP